MRYSPRTTTTNQPAHKAPNEPARPLSAQARFARLLDNEHMCSETDFTQEKGNFNPTTARGLPLLMIIFNHKNCMKKCIFETLRNEMKYVLIIKESNFNEITRKSTHRCARLTCITWLTYITCITSIT